MSNDNQNDTPEHRLWCAVLHSFVKEVRHWKGTDRAKDLLRLADSEYYKMICDLIGVDHEHFIEEIEKELGFYVKPKEREWFPNR